MIGEIGTLYVDEQPLDLERVSFRDGRMWFYAAASLADLSGPPPVGLTDVRLHAPDGSVVLMAWVDIPRVGISPATHYAIRLPFAIEGSRPGEPWATHAKVEA